MIELMQKISAMLGCEVNKIIISNPFKKSETYKKVIIENINDIFHVSKYTEKQVFHDNIAISKFADYLFDLVNERYKQINAWSDGKEHIMLISKNGKVSYKTKSSAVEKAQSESHNRKKNYILAEGEIIPPLVDMGIFTREGKIINQMYSKFKQINRFLEIIDDEINSSGLENINVIDFGCGKSYLTFILYYYLTKIKNIKVNMIGLDLKEDVINKCNVAAQKYGYNGLRFELGDINGYKAPFDVDMVITLHACDTATDYALYNAISWNAKYIFSVPCCQHELNEQITPESLRIMSRYGIIKERFSALATDAIRGNALEYMGYKTQILEFIDLDHTPKNILIRAVKRKNTTAETKNNALSEIDALRNEFGFTPTLCKLLNI